MKHAITSVEYLLRMKGFTHGAGGFPMDSAHSESEDYTLGYQSGQLARRTYSVQVCAKLNLVNPEVHAASLG